ncbi:hypothetical protein DM860_017980 [Cuscuta australis]|uniref:Replication factor A C-terminal domain-containing protein n=1 Tax=Cuscuta australis TaxID=267555 RepID=A0A328DXX0_9ASTE|nr:hypothetical protein DM860_017980 [Cuscuta australis]
MYYCVNCTCRVLNVTPRYLIKLTVVDDSGQTTFVLFDREATSILNTSCVLLLEKADSDGEYAVYGTIKGIDCGPDWFIATCRCGSENVPGFDIQPDAFQRFLIDKSFFFKVEVKTEHFNEFEPTYHVIDICLNQRIISKYKDVNSIFFTAQTDVTLGFSTAEKTSTRCISIGETSSCAKVKLHVVSYFSFMYSK